MNKSLENHSKALRSFENLQDKLGVAHSCSSLGEIFLFKEEWSRSRNYLERSLKLFKELDDKSGTADSLSLLGRLNLETGDFATAFFTAEGELEVIRYFRKSQKNVRGISFFDRTRTKTG